MRNAIVLLVAVPSFVLLGVLPLACDGDLPPTKSPDNAPVTYAPPASDSQAPVSTAPADVSPPMASTTTPVPTPSASASASSAPPAPPFLLPDAVLALGMKPNASVIVAKLKKIENTLKGSKSEGWECTFEVVKTISGKPEKTTSTPCGPAFKPKVGTTFVVTILPSRMAWASIDPGQYVEVPAGKEDEAFRANAARVAVLKK